MGAAAYRRGSERIRADIDACTPRARAHELEERGELEALRRELRRARRSLGVLRLTLDEERRRALEQEERARLERAAWFRALEAARTAHRRLSAIVRAELAPARFLEALEALEREEA